MALRRCAGRPAGLVRSSVIVAVDPPRTIRPTIRRWDRPFPRYRAGRHRDAALFCMERQPAVLQLDESKHPLFFSLLYNISQKSHQVRVGPENWRMAATK